LTASVAIDNFEIVLSPPILFLQKILTIKK